MKFTYRTFPVLVLATCSVLLVSLGCSAPTSTSEEPTALPQLSISREIDSESDWQDTGYGVTPSNIVQIEYVSGEWTTFKGYHDYVDADGNKDLGDSRNPNHPVPSAFPGVLIAKIEDGTPFAIGNAATFKPRAIGPLYLQINDDYLQDNKGNITVQITISLLPDDPDVASVLAPTQGSAAVESESAPASAPAQSSVPQLAWKLTADNPVIENGIVYTSDLQPQVRSLIDGRLIWESSSSGRIVGADQEFVYVAPASQRIDALDRRNGQMVWSAMLREPLTHRAEIRYYNDSLVLVETWAPATVIIMKGTGDNGEFSRGGSAVGDTWVIDLHEGRSLRRGTINHTIWTIPEGYDTYLCDDVLFYDKDKEVGLVEAINVHTGQVIWEQQFPGNLLTAHCPIGLPRRNSFKWGDLLNETQHVYGAILRPSVDPASSYTYAFVSDWPTHHLISFDLHTGEIQSFYQNVILDVLTGVDRDERESSYRWRGGAVGLDIFSHPGYVLTRAIDPQNLATKWENLQVALNAVLGSSDDTIIGYIGEIGSGGDGELIGLDAEDGTEIWRLDTGKLEIYEIVDGYLIFTLEEDPDTIQFLNLDTRSIDSSVELSEVDAVFQTDSQVVGWSETGLVVIDMP